MDVTYVLCPLTSSTTTSVYEKIVSQDLVFLFVRIYSCSIGIFCFSEYWVNTIQIFFTHYFFPFILFKLNFHLLNSYSQRLVAIASPWFSYPDHSTLVRSGSSQLFTILVQKQYYARGSWKYFWRYLCNPSYLDLNTTIRYTPFEY